MNVPLVTSKIFNHQFILFISLLIGMLAYENHLYDFYFYLSAIFIILTYFYILKENKAQFKFKPVWFVFLLFYFLSFIISIIYNGDLQGASRLATIFFVFFVCLLGVRVIDDFLYILLFLLCPVLIVSYLIQFTSLLSYLWDFLYFRNASIFFDPNFASCFLGLGAIISLTYMKNFFLKYCLTTLFLGACFFTFSKGGVLAILFSLFVYLIQRGKMLYIFIGLVVFVIAYWSFYKIDLTMFRFEQGLNERDRLWGGVIDYILIQQNIFGVGFDDSQNFFLKNGFTNTSTHNYYFDTLLMYGALPFIMNIIFSIFTMVSMFFNKSKYLPFFVFLFIQSNSVLISFGGLSLLSFMMTFLAVSQMINLKALKVENE